MIGNIIYSILIIAIGVFGIAEIFFVIDHWNMVVSRSEVCIGIAMGLLTLSLFIICITALIYNIQDK